MITFNAQIYSTEKVDRAMLCQQSGAKILYLGEPDPYLDQVTNNSLIYASILTPPYEAFQAVLNEDYARFGALYTEHLNTEEAQMFIATIVAAIYKGINIVLLFPEDTGDLKYPDFMLKFIFTNLGIQIATDDYPLFLICYIDIIVLVHMSMYI